MKLRRHHIFSLFLLLALLLAGISQQAQTHTIPFDSSAIKLRSIPAASLEKYRHDNDFDYTKEDAKGKSGWDLFWFRVFRYLNNMTNGAGWRVAIRFLLWGLCIFVIVYAIIKLTGMQGIGMFTGNRQAETVGYEVTDDNIYAINFNEAIANAIGQGNYRLSIRLLYLQTLRRMADRELIHWKPNKTNDVYAQELHGSNYYDDFAYLTYAYDYAWYGDFSVEEEQFRQVQQHFQTFQHRLPA